MVYLFLWAKTITDHRRPKGLPKTRDLPLSPGTECNTPAWVWFRRTAGKAVFQLAACHINCSNPCLETRKEECGEMQERARQGRPSNQPTPGSRAPDGWSKMTGQLSGPFLYLQVVKTQRGQGQFRGKHQL